MVQRITTLWKRKTYILMHHSKWWKIGKKKLLNCWQRPMSLTEVKKKKEKEREKKKRKSTIS